MYKMLIVDDSLLARQVIKNIFKDSFYIVEASSGYEAFEILKNNRNRIDIVILDMVMNDISGTDVLEFLKSNKAFKNLPVVAMSGDEETQLEALKAGAWDFFSKLEAVDIMKVRVQNVLERGHSIAYQERERLASRVLSVVMNISQDMMFEWNLGEDTLEATGRYVDTITSGRTINNFTEHLTSGRFISLEDSDLFLTTSLSLTVSEPSSVIEIKFATGVESKSWFRCTIKGEFDENGKLKSVLGLLAYIQQYKSAIDAATVKAETDGLTGLLNRTSFEELVSTDLANSKNHSAFILIDVDNFKNVNDTLGHIVGDEVLQIVGMRTRNCFRDTDYVARIGGDEFAVYMRNINYFEDLTSKLESILSENRVPIRNGDSSLFQYVSIGACYINPNSKLNSFGTVYKKADDALYICKEQGKNGYNLIES